MKSIKKQFFFVFVLITVSAFVHCKDSSVTENEQLKGKYVATTFTQPTSNDEWVDILEYGGSLEVEFLSGSKVNVYMTTPHETPAVEGEPKGNYSGNFSVSGDTLRFSNMPFFWALDDFYYFFIKGNQLVLRDLPGRFKAFKIILEKK